MSTDRHKTKPKAVRMPDGLLARVEAARGGETVNAFIVAAIEERLQRREGGSTLAVAPPAAAPVVAAEGEQPEPARRNCKHRNMKMAKGVCPDCNEWTVRS